MPQSGLGLALSGGMDSTTVGWHAARARAEAGEDELAAYTLDFERFPDADEREFVESALTAIPCRHAWLPGEQAYPLGDWPDTFAAEDEPPPTFGAVAMIDILSAAAGGGATGVMTGHGADHMLIASPTQRVELLARGELLADSLALRRRHGRCRRSRARLATPRAWRCCATRPGCSPCAATRRSSTCCSATSWRTPA